MKEEKNELKKGGFGTASLVLGIISLIIAGIPLGILAIIFGAIALHKEQKYGMAGLILGIAGFITAILLLMFFVMPLVALM